MLTYISFKHASFDLYTWILCGFRNSSQRWSTLTLGNVVLAMWAFNGKGRFSGGLPIENLFICQSKPDFVLLITATQLHGIITKIYSSYFGEGVPIPNMFKLQVSVFVFFFRFIIIFLQFDYTAQTCLPIFKLDITNDAIWAKHSPFEGLVGDKFHLGVLKPKALRGRREWTIQFKHFPAYPIRSKKQLKNINNCSYIPQHAACKRAS